MSWPRFHSLPYREDASAYLECLRDLPLPVWLDSGRPTLKSGRYDVLVADPFDSLRLSARDASQAIPSMRKMLGEVRSTGCPTLPFCGGLVGFLSYDLGRAWQGLPLVSAEVGVDDLYAGLYDWALVVDHQQRVTTLVGTGLAENTRRGWQSLCDLFTRAQPTPAAASVVGTISEWGMPEDQYAEAFARIQRYIRNGDIYQVNFTHRISALSQADPWEMYRQLRRISPAPYGAYLDLGNYQVLSNSPEQFLSLKSGRVRTRPIKGTRPRGATIQRDAQLRAELALHPKDRAENLMIVDLLRNDIGRVCRPGSIEVPELFAIETYATVHHLVSTVQGQLEPDKDAFDLLEACFPGGSITGAPKRRAMEIIDELEPRRRQVYCGSVFRLGYDGSLDSNISIRTVLRHGEDLRYWAGGGIVADSHCDSEYQESLDKAMAFFRLLGYSRLAR